MSQSVLANVQASGLPVKQVQFSWDPRDGTYKGVQIGYLTSGTNFVTGSSVQVVAANTSGTFRCHSFPCKKATFVNQRVPMYRVYKNDETGNAAYQNWVPVNSGGWNNRVEIEGIQNLQDLAIQSDSTSTTSVSGVVFCVS